MSVTTQIPVRPIIMPGGGYQVKQGATPRGEVAPRLTSLAGKRVALYCNRKFVGMKSLEVMEKALHEAGVSETFFVWAPCSARPADTALKLAATADAVICSSAD